MYINKMIKWGHYIHRSDFTPTVKVFDSNENTIVSTLSDSSIRIAVCVVRDVMMFYEYEHDHAKYE